MPMRDNERRAQASCGMDRFWTMNPEQWRCLVLFMKAILLAVTRPKEQVEDAVNEALKALEWHITTYTK